jgi:hypothetical protein
MVAESITLKTRPMGSMCEMAILRRLMWTARRISSAFRPFGHPTVRTASLHTNDCAVTLRPAYPKATLAVTMRL